MALTKKSNLSASAKALIESATGRRTIAYNVAEFSTSIQVQNPMKAALDYDDMVLERIKEMYERRCHKGAYIEKINRIVASSNNITLVRVHETIVGEIGVVFEATIVQLNPGDLVLARVTAMSGTGIYSLAAHSGYFDCVVKSDPSFEVKVGDWVLLVAAEIEYEPRKQKFIALCDWFTGVTYMVRNCVGSEIAITEEFRKPDTPIKLPGEDKIPAAAKKLEGSLKPGLWAFWFCGDGSIWYAGLQGAENYPATKIPTHNIMVSQGNMVDTVNRINFVLDDAPHIKRLLRRE